MSDWVLALVPTYGLWLLGTVTFLSCLALPVPCSLVMLTAGGFAAAEDLVTWQVGAAALAGAVAGDQTGYGIGRKGGAALLARLGGEASRGKLIARAVDLMERRGAIGIFFTRWLFSPVGPYANFAAGATGFRWPSFTLWGVLGEAVWVGLYVTLGYVFAGNIDAASDMAGELLGILAAAAALLGFGYWLVTALRTES